MPKKSSEVYWVKYVTPEEKGAGVLIEGSDE